MRAENIEAVNLIYCDVGYRNFVPKLIIPIIFNKQNQKLEKKLVFECFFFNKK